MAGRNKRQVARKGSLAHDVFKDHLDQLARHIETQGARGLRGLYEDGRAELVARLKEVGRKDQRVEATVLRAQLAQVDAVLGITGRRLREHLGDTAATAARMGADHGADEFKRLSQRFKGTVPSVNLDASRTLRGLVTGQDSTLLRRHKVLSEGWSLKAISTVERTLSTAVLIGKPLDKVVDDVEGALGTERWRAERIVRTECLLGDTPVEGAMVRAVFRRRYKGNVVKIVTEAGRHLTATPNHPVLTRRGWVGAGELKKTDYMVCDTRQKDLRAALDQHVAARPVAIAEIFDSLSTVGVIQRPCSHPDFHGDGLDGDVDIARPDRPLSFGSFAPLRQPTGELFLTEPDTAAAGLGLSFGDADLVAHRRSDLWSPHDVAGVAYAKVDEVRAHLQRVGDRLCRLAAKVALDNFGGRHVVAVPIPAAFDELGFGGDDDARALESSRHRSARRPHSAGNFGDTLTGPIEFDRVRNVDIEVFEGHVFNLSTEHGYYLAGGVYTANCAYAHGAAKQEAMATAGVKRKRLVETFDNRTGDDSFLIHGQTVPVDEAFNYKRKAAGGGWVLVAFMHPPNRPNDRATVIPWDSEWDEDELTRPLTRDELKAAMTTRWRNEVGVSIPPGHRVGRRYLA